MPPREPLADRFWRKVKRGDSCWWWTGAVGSSGYGYIGNGDGNRVSLVHRVAYELVKGPIPSGLHIDHLCSNRRCVNPEHLEAVTQAENNRRANAIRWAKYKAAQQE